MLARSLLLTSILATILSPAMSRKSRPFYLSSYRGPSGSLQLMFPSQYTDDVDGSRATPCCVDTLNAGACRSIFRRNTERFTHMCRTNVDFSFIQCCHSCHFAHDIDLKTLEGIELFSHTSLYDHDVWRLLQAPGAKCADRRSGRVCESLLTKNVAEKQMQQLGISKSRRIKVSTTIMGGLEISPRDAPCTYSTVAFRSCRRTCGYCGTGRHRFAITYNATIARDPRVCHHLKGFHGY